VDEKLFLNPESGDADGLLTLTKSGKAPKTRITNHAGLYGIYQNLYLADEQSAKDRTRIMDMFDGAAPYDPIVLRRLGQAYRANLNFGEAAADLEKALSAYNDLVTSVDRLVNVKTKFGDESQREEYGSIISEEFHRILSKDWPAFYFRQQLLSYYFIAQGLAVAFFEDERNWQWNICPIGDFLIPRGTPATEDKVEIACVRRIYLTHELYKYIENEKVAKEAGWNVDAVKQAIRDATTTLPVDSYNWEEIQRELKNNDLYFAHVRSREVHVVHYYVREFDGSYSHAIGRRDGVGDFLFKKLHRFKSASEAFHIFTYGVGNGQYHSIRGLGYKIFPHIQMTNRLRCAMADGAMLQTSVLLQPQSAEDVSRMTMAYSGPLSFLPPGLQVVKTDYPNLAAGVMPIVNEMAMVRQSNTGSYRTQMNAAGGNPRTATEVEAQIANEAILSANSLNLFYVPWGRLLREQFRRLQRDTWISGEPGAEEAKKFRKRLEERGVPWQAVKEVYDVDAVRAVGLGSPAARLTAFNEFMQLLPRFDEVGQVNAIRDRVAARVGYEQVDRYIPNPTVKNRIPVDAKIAELENGSMQAGKMVTVMPNENHAIHLTVHLKETQPVVEAVQNGQVQDKQGTMMYLTMVYEHCNDHLTRIAGDKTKQAEIGQANLAMNLLREAVVNLQRDVEQDIRAAAEAQQQAALEQGAIQPISPQMQMKMQEHQLDMQLKQERAALDARFKELELKQKLALQDAQTAANLRSAFEKSSAPTA
jgi:hypothetical protein